MHMRMRQGATMTVVVLALFLMGQSVHAAWSDWLPWPFSAQSGPQVKTPSAGAQEAPPSGNQGFQPQQPPQQPTNNQPMPPQGQQPNQPSQQGDMTKPPFPQGQPEGKMMPPFAGDQEKREGMQPGQPNAFPQMQPCAEGQQPSREKPCFPGQGATQGQFPGGKEGQRPMMDQGRPPFNQQEQMGQKNQQPQMMQKGQQNQQQQQVNFDEQQERPQVFIDPQFVKQVAREISDQTRELNRLLKAAKKLAGAEAAVTEIQGLLGKIDEFKAKVKSAQGEDLQSAVEDFHDAQIWESLNGLRAKIELPKQLNEFEKQLKRVAKLGAQSSFKKLAEFGVDMDKVKADIASFSEKVTTIRSLLAAGNSDDAQEAMQEIWQGDFNPGDIEGALQQMRGMTDGLRRIKNKEILAQVKEIFVPVIEAMNNSDYREANQLLNEMQFEMQRVFAQLQRLNVKGTLSSDLRKKLQAFDDRIQQKLQQQSDNEQGQNQETESAQ